jgi:hypothetical protein
MPDEEIPDYPIEAWIVAPGTGSDTGTSTDKPLPGVQEALIAARILKLIQKLPPKTPGVANIRKGAIALAQSAGAKLSKAK